MSAGLRKSDRSGTLRAILAYDANNERSQTLIQDSQVILMQCLLAATRVSEM